VPLPAARRDAASLTFAGYAAGWLAGFIDDAPDRARLEAALEHRLLPVLGGLPLLKVLEADRDELYRRLANARATGTDDAARECLDLILEDAAEDWRAAPSLSSRRSGSVRQDTWLRE
jgi:hypothetical protein